MWQKIWGLLIGVGWLVWGCGGGGDGSSGLDGGFVLQSAGSLNLVAAVDAANPQAMDLTATLLDSNGVVIPNQQIAFAAEFPDATIVPGEDNQGAVFTDDNGRARVTLIAGLTTGRMRIVAEAPPGFNLSTALFVDITTQGFLSLGSLGVIPAAITFINPSTGTTADFQAMGGTPPYFFSNSTPSVGQIDTLGAVGEIGRYTLTGPLPTAESAARQDEITLVDSAADQVTATIEALFVTCDLEVSPQSLSFAEALEGEQGVITIIDGVPPFTVTQSLPEAGTLEINNNAMMVTFTVASPPVSAAPNTILIRDGRGCITTVDVTITPLAPCDFDVSPQSLSFAEALGGEQGVITIIDGVPPFAVTQSLPGAGTLEVDDDAMTVTYTVASPPVSAAPDTLLIVDSQGCTATINVTITVGPLTITPITATLAPEATQEFVVIGGVPPYQIVADGGTVSPSLVEASGDTFVYTAGTTSGLFIITVTDQEGGTAQAQVTIESGDS